MQNLTVTLSGTFPTCYRMKLETAANSFPLYLVPQRNLRTGFWKVPPSLRSRGPSPAKIPLRSLFVLVPYYSAPIDSLSFRPWH